MPERFDEEVLTTARWRWDEAVQSDAPVYTLTREGYSEKKKTAFLTVAGWVKQVARFRYYLELVGVPRMSENPPPYQPGVEWLKPYFGPESGLDTAPKAFAFLLGSLYGKLLTVQGRRGVNVGANALTWLRRLSLSGAELPDLYNKVRGKLLEYGAERSRRIRELNEELAELGRRLGNEIRLDETATCYFLLLGQALAVKMMPPKEYNLRLMSPTNDPGSIPTKGKSLVVVVALNGILHFRIFDGAAKKVVDTDETKLTAKASQIKDLRNQLETLSPPHELTSSEKRGVIAAVTSIVGRTRPKKKEGK